MGRVLASRRAEYRDLFREDGFAKPIEGLRAIPAIAALMPKVWLNRGAIDDA